MTAPLLCINAEQVHTFRYAGDYCGLHNCHYMNQLSIDKQTHPGPGFVLGF